MFYSDIAIMESFWLVRWRIELQETMDSKDCNASLPFLFISHIMTNSSNFQVRHLHLFFFNSTMSIPCSLL